MGDVGATDVEGPSQDTWGSPASPARGRGCERAGGGGRWIKNASAAPALAPTAPRPIRSVNLARQSYVFLDFGKLSYVHFGEFG